MKYLYLQEGDTVCEGDEVEISNDGWRDPEKWVETTRAGVKAPNPNYISHRKYRRKIQGG